MPQLRVLQGTASISAARCPADGRAGSPSQAPPGVVLRRRCSRSSPPPPSGRGADWRGGAGPPISLGTVHSTRSIEAAVRRPAPNPEDTWRRIGASRSSVSATWASRSRSPSSRPGVEVEGVDVAPARVAELNARHSPIDDITDERLAAALASGLRVVAPGRSAPARRGCAVRVRADTDHHHQGSRPGSGPRGRRVRPRRPARRPPRGPPVHDLPGHDDGSLPRGRSRQSGLHAGTDFDLAFAPERVNPGDPASSGRGVPRLVGGTTAAATHRARPPCWDT